MTMNVPRAADTHAFQFRIGPILLDCRMTLSRESARSSSTSFVSSDDALSDTITSNGDKVCERAEPTQRLSQPALLKVGIAIVKRGPVEDARALMRGAVRV